MSAFSGISHKEILNTSNSYFLPGSEFTDIDTKMIKDLGHEIASNFESDEEKVKALFYWVRDSIKYSVGLNADKASDTVIRGFGSCLNKSNLLVALLRVNGYPAAFSIMRVKTREYFGPLGFERYRPLVSEESNHTYAQVYLNNAWIKLDCTDDTELCESTQHLEMQGEPVEFDGVNHACLNLDSNHIIKDDEIPIHNVDYIFSKKPKVPSAIINIFNLCMSYVRHNGKYCSSVKEIEDSFFEYLENNHPEKYKLFLLIENKKMNKAIKKVLLFTAIIRNKQGYL